MISRKALVLVALALTAGCSQADQSVDRVPFDPDYTTYARVLKSSIEGELVDYASLKANRSGLDSVVSGFASLSPEELGRMTSDEQMAFWINAYNAITLRSVIDAYPVESIKDIDGVWTEKKWPVAGQKVTLDHIEHKVLRPQFHDARVHFAVNCASRGCPPLLDVPFKGETLGTQLDRMAAAFVGHPSRTIIDAPSATVRTSEVFNWFGDDFIPQFGGEKAFAYLSPKEAATLGFIRLYANDGLRSVIDSVDRWKIEYMPYDWSLNDTPR